MSVFIITVVIPEGLELNRSYTLHWRKILLNPILMKSGRKTSRPEAQLYRGCLKTQAQQSGLSLISLKKFYLRWVSDKESTSISAFVLFA